MNDNFRNKIFLSIIVSVILVTSILVINSPNAEAVTRTVIRTVDPIAVSTAFNGWQVVPICTPSPACINSAKIAALTDTPIDDAKYVKSLLNNDRLGLVPQSISDAQSVNYVKIIAYAKKVDTTTKATKFSLTFTKGSTFDSLPKGGYALTPVYDSNLSTPQLDAYTRTLTTNLFTGAPFTPAEVNTWTSGGAQLSLGIEQNTDAKEVRVTKLAYEISIQVNPTIQINSIIPGTILWGDSVTASGSATGYVSSDYVLIDWNDGTTSSATLSPSGAWTATHPYQKGTVGTHNVKAQLKDSSDVIIAESTTLPVTVQVHPTVIFPTNDIGPTLWGAPISKTATLTDTYLGTPISGATISLGGTGLGTLPPSATTADGTGSISVSGYAPGGPAATVAVSVIYAGDGNYAGASVEDDTYLTLVHPTVIFPTNDIGPTLWGAPISKTATLTDTYLGTPISGAIISLGGSGRGTLPTSATTADGTGSIASGSISVSGKAPGGPAATVAVSVIYAGDGNYAGASVEDDTYPTLVHPTSLTSGIFGNLFAGNQFIVSGKLTDTFTGKGVTGKPISLGDTGLSNLVTPTQTGGISFSGTGMVVASDGGSNVLNVPQGTVINIPTNAPILKFSLKNLVVGDGTNVVQITLNGEVDPVSTPIVTATQDFYLTRTAGISQAVITSFPGGDTSGTLSIVGLQTQNEVSEVIDDVNFNSVDVGTYSSLVASGGSYSSKGTLGSAANNLQITSTFTEDSSYSGSSAPPINYSIQPQTPGTGPAATVITDSGVGIVAAAACTDTDGDYLCDTWEGAGNGVPIGSGSSKLALPGSDPNHKDIYVEIDYMNGHSPNAASITDVVNAFRDSGVSNPTGTGITLHVVTDEQISHVASMNLWTDSNNDYTNDFNSIKMSYLGTPSEHPTLDVSTYSDTVVNDASLPATKKTLTIDNVKISTPTSTPTSGATTGTVTIKETVTIPSGVTFTKGTPSVISPGAGITITSATASVSGSGTTRNVVLTVKFSTGAVTPAVTLGTVKFPYTLGGSGGTSTPARVFGSPTIITDLITAKSQAYHYFLWAHSIGSCGPSGQSESPGNDGVVSLGCDWHTAEDPLVYVAPAGHTATVGTEQEQAGTFMHELGHNLGLQHGGPYKNAAGTILPADTNINCKPNYPSVMSYTRQVPNYLAVGAGWLLDFSHGLITPSLDESALREDTGLTTTAASPPTIVWNTPVASGGLTYRTQTVGPNIDWSGAGGILSGSILSSPVDINNFGIVGCQASLPDPNGQHIDRDDWGNLNYNLRQGIYGQFDAAYPNYPSTPSDEDAAVSRSIIIDGAIYVETIAPPAADGSTTKNGGNTVPLKPVIVDVNGNPIDFAVIDAFVAREYPPGTMGPYEKIGDLVYSSGHYQINWNTPANAPGKYWIQFKLHNDLGQNKVRLLVDPNHIFIDPTGTQASITMSLTP